MNGDAESPWNAWRMISLRAGPDVCVHGRPDHQVLIRQLAEALGLDLPALSLTPQQVWNGLLDEVEHQRRNVTEGL